MAFKDVRASLGRNHPDTLEAWRNFNEKNDNIKNFTVSSQVAYERGVASQLKDTPKLFHSYIKHRKVGRPGVGPLKLNSREITDDPSKMAEAFVNAFSSVFSTRAHDVSAAHLS